MMKSKYRSSHTILHKLVLSMLVFASLAFFTGCEQKQVAKTGEKAPEISDTDIHGEIINLSKFKGNVVVLYFWTDSCCGDSLKYVERYYRQIKDRGLVVLAINEKNNTDIVQSYAETNRLTFTMLTDGMGMTAREYGVFGFPTIFILDREGVIRKKILGYITTAQLGKLVAQYL
jgi:peroxiredoxin